MMLLELPNGDFISPMTVRGIRTIVGDDMGPRVLIDVTTAAQVIMVEFDNVETARRWAGTFATEVNRQVMYDESRQIDPNILTVSAT